MSPRLFATALGILAAGLFGGPSSAQEGVDRGEAARRAGVRLAAVQAAQKILQGFEGHRPRGLEAAWAAAMLEDIEEHRRLRASQGLCRHDYRERLERALAGELGELQGSFHPQGGEQWFSTGWVEAYLEEHLAGERARRFEASESNFLPEIFEKARQRAVAEQLAALPSISHPQEGEVDRLGKIGWPRPQVTELVDRLVVDLRRGGAFLEEVERQLQVRGRDLVEEARAQYQLQLAALEGPVPAPARQAAGIAEALTGHLEDGRRNWQTNHPRGHLFGPFPSVRKKLEARARQLEVDRFRLFLRSYRHAISEGELRGIVAGDLKAHGETKASQRLLENELLPDAIRRALDRYAAPFEGDPGHGDFRRRLEDLQRTDPSVGGTLRNRFASQLQAALKRVRGGLADQQLGRWFPALDDGSWVVPEQDLKELERHPRGRHPLSFEKSLGLLGSAAGRFPPQLLLEETRQRVVGHTGELLEQGEKAWAGQGKVIDRVELSISEVFAAEGKHSRGLEVWEEHFLRQARDQWRQRVEGPGAAVVEEKYPKLFPLMEKRLKERIRRDWKVPEAPPSPPPIPESDPARVGPGPGPGPDGGRGEQETSDPEPAEERGWLERLFGLLGCPEIGDAGKRGVCIPLGWVLLLVIALILSNFGWLVWRWRLRRASTADL